MRWERFFPRLAVSVLVAIAVALGHITLGQPVNDAQFYLGIVLGVVGLSFADLLDALRLLALARARGRVL